MRTTEFLWQEGHTAHATEAEAREETMRMLQVYADFAENYMAMPVIQGEKTAGERFPGAVATLQHRGDDAGPESVAGWHVALPRAELLASPGDQIQDQNGEEVYAWTTSWGVSTRLVGGIVMTHADDDGMVIPPRLAPRHAVILPIYRNDEERSQGAGVL